MSNLILPLSVTIIMFIYDYIFRVNSKKENNQAVLNELADMHEVEDYQIQ